MIIKRWINTLIDSKSLNKKFSLTTEDCIETLNDL